MKLVNPSATLIQVENPFKKIEFVGRTCYKSSSDMTEETAKKFYSTLVSRKHFAMVEHATFCFQVSESFVLDNFPNLFKGMFLRKKVCNNLFIHCTYNPVMDRYLVSGNLRALNDSFYVELLDALYELDPLLVYNENYKHLSNVPERNKASVVSLENLDGVSIHEFLNHFYMTVKFVCDRGVSHEIVRHRLASFAQESTRYCNYGKDKFGNEITCIKPHGFDRWSADAKACFCTSMVDSQKDYMFLIQSGLSPQQARAVLPTALKTEIIMTTYAEEWQHFFNLRSKGTTGAPHPDMKVVADKAQILFNAKKVQLLVE